MPEYRAYLIGSDGHFRDAVGMNCEDDKSASERAANLAEAEAVEIELWQGARMIAKFPQRDNPMSDSRFAFGSNPVK
jgi:hypothetical protein